MSASKVRFLVVAVTALLLLQGNKDLPTTFRIDPKLSREKETLPGLNNGEPRPIAVVAGPTGKETEVVANEVLFHPASEKELDAFLSKYGGKVLRDGTPYVGDDLPKDHRPIESDGWYLIRVDPNLSHTDDLEQNLAAGPLVGEYRFSSEEAARFFAIFLREKDLSLGPNLVLRPQAIPEHPDDFGGNLDARTFFWLTEDDDPAMPGDQGLSTGVIRAWDYLRYHGLPPQNGTYRPARVAIIDGGFALSETDGTPLDGNLDYGFGMMQVDMVDQDGLAGGPNLMSCTGGASCPWHGQGAFGVAGAEPGNGFGGAGTGGRVVWPLLVRTGYDLFTVGDGIRAASILGADVISLSLGGGCGDWEWACRQGGPFNVYSRLQNDVYWPLSSSQVVVAAAGNEGEQLTGTDLIPCALDGVICVGSVDRNGMNVFNFGTPVDIWAPTRILSTVTPETRAVDADDVGVDEVKRMGGTSASTPFIAGVVGLMKVLNPAITPQSVFDILQTTANPSPDPKVHIGWVDALRAVKEVRANQPPVVQWSAPTSATLAWTGSTLKAAASDPEVAPADLWQWPMTVSFSSSLNGPLCSDTTPPYSCFSGPLALGNHVITATATDAFGAASSTTRSFQVINHPPAPDIAEPVPAGTYFAHQPVHLEAYVPDPDELIPQNAVQWTSNLDGFLGTGWARNQLLSAGVHFLTVRATDGQGATGQDSVTITVRPGTGLPSVQILEPGPEGIGVAPGTVVTLRGSAVDPEDGVLTGTRLVWTSDRDGFLGTGQMLNVVLSGPAVPCNPEIVIHTITLRATDSNGNSVSVTVRVAVGVVC